jgi:phage terminase large subunit
VSATTAAPRDSAAVVALAVRDHPEWFVREILGERRFYDKQAEMLRAVRDHRRVSVVGCNSSGKDWTSGRIILWWLEAHSPAKVVVYGPTHRQVDSIVFNEARTAHRRARELSRPDGYQLKGRMWRLPNYEIDEENWAHGLATDDPFNIQGFHSPNLLLILTEAHAISPVEMDALLRLNARCILMTGNPFVSHGPFYESHHATRDRWHTIEISAFDTPNLQPDVLAGENPPIPGMVDAEVVAERREDWGEDSPLYIGSILGRFPDGLDDAIVPLWLAMESAKRDPTPAEDREGEVILAADIAEEGRDQTVVVRRQGNDADIVWRAHERDVMRTAGKLAQLCTEERVDKLVVDASGVGSGVAARLKELRGQLATQASQDAAAEGEAAARDPESRRYSLRDTRVVAFKGGEKAVKNADYQNLISECWMAIRAYCEAGGRIPDDPALIGQVSSRESHIQSDMRIMIEPKKDMRKAGKKSPDEADALAMTFTKKGAGAALYV